MSIRERFIKEFEKRGGIAVSAEIDALITAIDDESASIKPAQKQNGKKDSGE